MTGRAGMTRQQLCDEIDVHAGAWRRMLDQRDSAASRLNQLEHIHAQTAADLAEAYDMACRAHPAVSKAIQAAEVAARDKAAADAASAGIKQRSDRKRAMRAQSLLATGAGGDDTNVVTGLPAATAAKTKLGA